MTTEYYQIPSQQGLLPLLDTSSPDPWLASATSALSLSDTWSVKGSKSSSSSSSLSHPSLFDSSDADALSWKNVIPMQNAGMTKGAMKAPIKPRQFNSISASSQIDAWSVVDENDNTNIKQHKRTPSNNSVTKSVDPEDKQIEDELSHQNRYKTELCKSFNETGICRYGTKCQFAHGKEEVRPILRHPKYKTETCKTFHTTGTCPYGTRCRFIHTKSKEETLMTIKPSMSSVVELEEEDIDDGEIVSLNPPPGIPVPKWSKSWNMAMGSPVVQRKNTRLSAGLSQPEPTF
jgi:butyrate response factor 1